MHPDRCGNLDSTADSQGKVGMSSIIFSSLSIVFEVNVNNGIGEHEIDIVDEIQIVYIIPS